MIHHLPMGLMWNMPIPVACSLAVATDGLAVTCGQCPLDAEGRVLAPGDAAAQAALVTTMGQGVLGHLPKEHHAALLVVYHDCADPAEVLVPLGRAFPGAELAPVRLPHFYYPGMRIEVDLYATAAPPRRTIAQNGPARLARIEGGPLTLVHLSAPDIASALPLLSGIDARQLLSAQWFSAEQPPASHLPDPAARVLPPGGGVSAVLTLAPDPVAAQTTPGGAVLRRAGRFAWLSAQGTAPDLAAAAHQAMDALSLPEIPGLTVLKATTHYRGGPNPQDLHANLAVRHARFPMPGPASTGVPVQALASATLAVDMLAMIDSAAGPT
jgi:enamine deaminase RidA (YjgF/YER057c/UK114 family)